MSRLNLLIFALLCALLPAARACTSGGTDCVHGTCNAQGTCVCSQGYEGTKCNTPQCTQTCAPHGFCSAPDECTCYPGWDASDCTTPLCDPECDPDHGQCIQPNQCQCDQGWGGTLCFIADCIDCKNGGFCLQPDICTCQGGFTGKTCTECKDGYFGKDCSTCPGFTKDGAEVTVCNGHGKCTDGFNGEGGCFCADGWAGFDCRQCAPGYGGLGCKPSATGPVLITLLVITLVVAGFVYWRRRQTGSIGSPFAFFSSSSSAASSGGAADRTPLRSSDYGSSSSTAPTEGTSLSEIKTG